MKKLVLSIAVLLLLPSLAGAAPKKKPIKFEYLQTLYDEAIDGVPEDGHRDIGKAIKVADRCSLDDARWAKAMDDGQTQVNVLYEMLQGAVVCWQGAERRVTKHGSLEAPTAFVAARTRYLEAFRSYIWAIEAKLASDRQSTCTRLKTALTEVEKAAEATNGLVEKFKAEANQMLAAKAAADAKGLADTIADETANQRCE